MTEQTLTREEYKIQALLERVSSLTAGYENQVADLRVEITLAQKYIAQLEEAADDKTAEQKSE